MRTNAEFLVQRQLGSGDIWRVGEVQAPITWKFEVGDFFEVFVDCLYAPNLIANIHSWPFLVQWTPEGVFHDDVFAPSGI